MKHSEWPITVAGDADGAVLADFWITYLWREDQWTQMYFGHSSADALSALQGPLRGLGLRRVNAGERVLLQAQDGQIPVVLVHQCIREGWNSTSPEAVRGAVPDAEHPVRDNLDGSWPPAWAGDQNEAALGELWSTYQYGGQTWNAVHYAASFQRAMNALTPELRGLGLKRQNTRSGGALLRRGETHLFVTSLQTLHYGWTEPEAAQALRDTVRSHVHGTQTAEPIA